MATHTASLIHIDEDLRTEFRDFLARTGIAYREIYTRTNLHKKYALHSIANSISTFVNWSEHRKGRVSKPLMEATQAELRDFLHLQGRAILSSLPPADAEEAKTVALRYRRKRKSASSDLSVREAAPKRRKPDPVFVTTSGMPDPPDEDDDQVDQEGDYSPASDDDYTEQSASSSSSSGFRFAPNSTLAPHVKPTSRLHASSGSASLSVSVSASSASLPAMSPKTTITPTYEADFDALDLWSPTSSSFTPFLLSASSLVTPVKATPKKFPSPFFSHNEVCQKLSTDRKVMEFLSHTPSQTDRHGNHTLPNFCESTLSPQESASPLSRSSCSSALGSPLSLASGSPLRPMSPLPGIEKEVKTPPAPVSPVSPAPPATPALLLASTTAAAASAPSVAQVADETESVKLLLDELRAVVAPTSSDSNPSSAVSSVLDELILRRDTASLKSIAASLLDMDIVPLLRDSLARGLLEDSCLAQKSLACLCRLTCCPDVIHHVRSTELLLETIVRLSDSPDAALRPHALLLSLQLGVIAASAV